MEIKITLAKLKEIKEISKLAVMFEDEQFKTIDKSKKNVLRLERRKKNAQKILEGDLKKIFKKKNCRIFVAKDGEKVAGYMWVSIRDNAGFARVKRYGRLNFAYIKKEYRGKRIFSNFIESSIKWFKQKKIKIVTLQTRPENKKALSIYKKKGFVISAIEMTGELR